MNQDPKWDTWIQKVSPRIQPVDFTKMYDAVRHVPGPSHDDPYGKSHVSSALVNIVDAAAFENDETMGFGFKISFRKNLSDRERQGGWSCCGNHSVQSEQCC